MFFYEDEVLSKTHIVSNLIKAKLGIFSRVIYARKCTTSLIDTKTSKDFLNQFHLQGGAASKFALGLFHNNELVGVAAFGVSRFSKKYDLELIRLCFLPGVRIPGGASKLISSAKTFSNCASLVSYSDNRYSSGQVYSAIGMVRIGESQPGYFYLDKRNYLKRLSRLSFQKHKLAQLHPELSGSTEWEIMQHLGYDRLWDCGTTAWGWAA